MNTVLDTINGLRSIHGSFSTRDVEEKDLQTILSASVKAANSSARQAYSIIVVKDKAVMKSFGYVGPVMLVYCTDFHRQAKLAGFHGFDHPLPGIREFSLGSFDAALAVQTGVLAAKSLGIDSLITNCIHRGDIRRVFEALDLPETGVFPIMAVVFGYPESEPGRKKERLADQAIIHRKTYKSPSTDECSRITEVYDEGRIGLMENSQWRKNGYDHYLQWFFDKWISLPRMGTDPGGEQGTDQFKDLLEDTGFLEAGDSIA